MARYASAYQVEVRHDGLNKYRMVRGSNAYEVEQRAAALVAQWNGEWARRLEVDNRRTQRLNSIFHKEEMKESAAERTSEAQELLSSLSTILVDGLATPSPFSWDFLKYQSSFPEPRPKDPSPDPTPSPPSKLADKYYVKIGPLEMLMPKRRQRMIDTAANLFKQDHDAWSAEVARIKCENEKAQEQHQENIAQWEAQKAEFEETRRAQHASVDARAAAAESGAENAVDELLDLALTFLPFPECINASFDVDYSATTKSSVIDANFPSPDDIPTLKEVRYVQARDEFSEKHISDAERARLYDNLLYQMALRSIIAVFAAAKPGYVERVTLNGWVDYVDRATGMDQRSCVLSLAVNRSDIDRIDFERVDPRECFKSLKGVAASKLIGLAPVAPLERPRLIDSRFVESQEVASTVDASMNLAAMDWQEFEHLVRQVFEHEFSGPGSEVHVTQASRDGGVDAIVHDPDPIKGGKIVIQAKRYTSTVDVGSVRDLYGTVLNEGATKGILVTTSQFGPDARKFATGKPLTLIDGNNLLFLLERMGIAARIDLREAKAILSAGS
jgi:restriction system protein